CRNAHPCPVRTRGSLPSPRTASRCASPRGSSPLFQGRTLPGQSANTERVPATPVRYLAGRPRTLGRPSVCLLLARAGHDAGATPHAEGASLLLKTCPDVHRNTTLRSALLEHPP